MKTTRLFSLLFALVCFACCYNARAADFVTKASQASGQNWNATIWSNAPSGTGVAPTAGNTYQLVDNGTAFGSTATGGNIANTKIRNLASAGVHTFPGDSLTMHTNTEIRAKTVGAILDFPGVGGNPGLILNGGVLNTGDATTFAITGKVSVTAPSFIVPADNGAGNMLQDRAFNFFAQLSGTAPIIIAQAGTTIPQQVTSGSNSFSGGWIVMAGWLRGNTPGSLGTGPILIDPNYPLAFPGGAVLSNGPAQVEFNYNISTPGTLSLSNSGKIILHQDVRFARVFVDGVQIANGTYPYAVAVGAYPNNVAAGGSGSISIGPVPATALTAVGRDNAVRLSWTGDASAAGNVIKRSLVAGGPYTPIATNSGAANFTDTTALNGTTYFYVVSAFNDGGTTPDSNEASATPVRDPTIAWVSDNPGALGWTGRVSGTGDDAFTTNILADYNIVRFSSADSQNTLLTQADIDALNTNDVIIFGRSLLSAAFQAPQGHQWNTNITKPIIVQSAFLIRQSRLGWFVAESAIDGFPMRINATTPSDPESAYLLNLFGTAETSGASTAGNYDELLDATTTNTSQTVDAPVAGGRILANAGTTNVIVEFPAGTVVKGGLNILAGYRLYFASGTRELNSPVSTAAGKDNLTPTGEAIFRRAVSLAIHNGVAPNLGDAPVITSQPSSTNACTGLPVTFSTAATGENPLYYQWYFSDGATFTNAIASGTNATFTIASLQTADAGFYAVVVTNVVGAITSSVAAVTIAGAATVAVGPANATNCPATPVTFTTTASGSGALTYTWRKGATVVQGPDGNNSYTIASVAPADAGAYSVTVIGDCNTVSNNFTLTVVAIPTISAQPQNQATPMGNGAVFSVTASTLATQPTTFQWTTNGVDVTGATASTFAISNLTLAANGMQVSVAVSNCAGGLLSSAATLTVTPITAISFDFNTPGQYTNAPYNLVGNDWHNTAIVNNQPFGPIIPFEVSTGGVGVATGGGGLDFMFNNATVQSSILHPITYDFSLPNKTLVVSVMVKIKFPLNNSRATQIGFVTQTNVDLDNSVGRSYMTVLLQSTAQPAPSFELRYGSKPNGANTFIESPAGGTVTLTTNKWYQITATFMNSSAATAGTYSVSATLQDRGADGLAAPTTVASINTSLTNVDVTSARNLFFVVRDIENCGVDYWDNVHVYSTIGDVAFVQEPASQTVLQGRTASFRALVDGTGPYTYQWNKNGSPIPGAGNWKYTTPALTLADDQAQYTVTVTGPNNTITSSPATVTVQADALDVLSVGSVDGGIIGLRFDQPVDKTSAETAANYTVNGVAAIAAQLRSYNNFQKFRTNGTEVLLTPAASISGAFTVAVANVTSISGTALSANNSATGLVAGLTGYDVDPTDQVNGQPGQSISLNGVLPPVGTYPGENFSFAPGGFEVTGGGHDIFGTHDGFRFVYKQVTGDFDVKMRVPYIDLVRTPNKGGFNARLSLDAGSPNVGTYANPLFPGRNFVEATARGNWNGASAGWGNNAANTAGYPNVWLRLRRSGNTFIRYTSTNGVNWTCEGQIAPTGSAVPLPATLYFGLAVNFNGGVNVIQQPVTAQFDNYGDFAGYPGAVIAITGQPVNISVAAGAAGTLFVTNTVTGGGIPGPFGEVSYLWQRTNSLSGGWTNMPTAGGTNNSVSTGPMFFGDNQARYRVIISAPGAALSVTSAVATVTVTDTAAPTLASVLQSLGDPPTLTLQFSERLSAASALNAANYFVTNSAGNQVLVTSVAFVNADQTAVILTLGGAGADNYSITLGALQDQNGLSVAANTRRTFTVGAIPTAPVVIEQYGGTPNAGNIMDILGFHKFLSGNPDFYAFSNSFAWNGGGAVPTGIDQYGQRVFTYFVPPTNGAYKFYVRGDDFVEFRMNTNSTGSTNPINQIIPIGTAGGVYTGSPGNEQAYKSMDMNLNTKYLNFEELNTGFIVTPGIGSNTVIRGMRFATANDAPERDPLTFTLEGSLTAGIAGPWTLIASNDTGLSATRLTYAPNIVFTNLDGTFSNDTAYVSYRVRFPTVRDSVAATAMQISEVQLLDANRANVLGGTIPQIVLTANNANYVVGNSVTNNLNAGQLYYMEVLFKESGGGDAMSLAVRAGSDANVPPQAEMASGLFAYPALLVPRIVSQVEIYTNLFVSGQNAQADNGLVALADAIASFKYMSRTPDVIAYNKYLGFSTNLAESGYNHYVGRVFSYFVPPASGNYRFYLRSDDASQLLINTSATDSTNPAGAVVVGQLGAFTAAYTQVAQNISLVGGQRYYIEGRWKEGTGGDGMYVAVRPQADAAVPANDAVGIDPGQLEFPTNLALNPVLPRSFITPVNPTVTEGQTVTFMGVGSVGLNFVWSKNGEQVMVNNQSGAPFPTPMFYETPPLTSADDGAVYALTLTNTFGTATATSRVTVLADATSPSIASAVASQYGDSVVVLFNENVTAATAGLVANYSIAGLQILSAEYDEITRNRVILRTRPQTPNALYTLVVNGVRDFSSTGNPTVNASKVFHAWGFGGLGGLYVEVWTNIQGGAAEFLQTDPRFLNNTPDVSFYTNQWGSGAFGANSGFDFYGARISGYFMPPSNGLYRFFIRGDDGTRLFMNTNGPDANGRVLIARNDGANSGNYQNGTGLGRVGTSISPIISLTNGTPYYMEALFKEGTGGDHMEVVMRAIDANTLTEIGGVPATPAVGDILNGGFFSAPGNPDLISSTGPPTELSVTENDLVDLRVVALPASVAPFASVQWAKSNANSVGFVNIPGATSLALAPFVVPRTDDGAAYRITGNLPGNVNLSYTTLLHVAFDITAPFMVSANSLDGNTIGVCFNEAVDPNTAEEEGNWSINGDINLHPLSAVVRASDPRTVLLTLISPVAGTFTLKADFIRDLAPTPNSGTSMATGSVQNLTPLDIGAPPGAGSSWTCTNGSIDVIAGGADIWGTSDQGHFTIGTRTGDFDVWVRVDSLTRVPGDNDGITKAGIMVRESLDPAARKLTVLGEPPASVGGRELYEASQRPTVGAATAAWSGGAATGTGPFGIPNGWIRIKRTGDLFTAYRSSDGVNWVAATTQTMVFPSTVYVGLAATAHIPSPSAGTTSAKFRDIHIPNPPTITVQPSPTNRVVLVHSNVSYTVTATNPPNSGTLRYQWRRNGVVIAGATSATLNIPDAQLTDTGTYTVEVGNDGGIVTSSPVTLTVINELPTFTAGSAIYNPGAGTFSASFPTANGVSYVVEYKDDLNTVPWTTLTTVVGDGTVKSFTDPGPLPPMRFYHVRVQ